MAVDIVLDAMLTHDLQLLGGAGMVQHVPEMTLRAGLVIVQLPQLLLVLQLQDDGAEHQQPAEHVEVEMALETLGLLRRLGQRWWTQVRGLVDGVPFGVVVEFQRVDQPVLLLAAAAGLPAEVALLTAVDAVGLFRRGGESEEGFCERELVVDFAGCEAEVCYVEEADC